MSACLSWDQWRAEHKTQQAASLDQEDVRGWPAPCLCGATWRRSPQGRFVIAHGGIHGYNRRDDD